MSLDGTSPARSPGTSEQYATCSQHDSPPNNVDHPAPYTPPVPPPPSEPPPAVKELRDSKENNATLSTNNHWGDKLSPLTHDQTKTFRVVAQNIHGIGTSDNGERQRAVLHSLHKHFQPSAICLSETQVDWKKPMGTNLWLRHLKSLWRHSHTAASTSACASQHTYQPGGTCTNVVSHWATRLHAKDTDTALGRWSSISLQGRGGKVITIITGYRVCAAPVTPTQTARAQQTRTLRHANSTRDPRQAFIEDIILFIQSCQIRNEEIIFAWDANEALSPTDPSQVERVLLECDLIDAHSNRHGSSGPATYNRGSSRIDFVCCSPTLIHSITAASITPFNFGHNSDHRALVVDFDAASMFGGPTAAIQIRQRRQLVSTNPRTVSAYLALIRTAFHSHKIIERSETLEHQLSLEGPTDALIEALTALDKQVTEIMLAAESKCSKTTTGPYPWSPILQRTSAHLHYWLTRLTQHTTATSSCEYLHALELELQIPNGQDTCQMSTSELLTQVRHARVEVKTAYAEATANRTAFLYEKIELHNSTGQKDAVDALAAIAKAEQQQRTWAQIRAALKPERSAGLDRIQVLDPASGEHQWVYTTDEIHNSILDNNIKRFRAHAATPFGSGARSTHLGDDCQSAAVEELLHGQYEFRLDELSDEARHWLKQLQFTTPVAKGEKVPIEISTDDFISAWMKFRESTASSPSGRHYGHYKTAAFAATAPPFTADGNNNPLYYPDLAVLHSRMCTLPLQYGFSLPRWQNSVNAMLEKSSGSRRVEKLRIIHLFEADFNFVLKLIWGRRLMRFAETHNLLGEDQHGSRAGRRATDACLEKRILYDFTCHTRSSLITVDNDAAGCYDRIIRTLAMVACLSMGLPAPAAEMHNITHTGMTHKVSTLHGISAGSYAASPEEALEGTGQGSGASPAIWCIICITMLHAFTLFAKGMAIFDPMHTIMLRIYTVYFVDDGMPGANDATAATATPDNTLVAQAEKEAQSWEKILHASGGALETTKCFTYMLFHEWNDSGIPRLRKPDNIIPRVRLTQSETGEANILTCVDPSKGIRTIGVRIAPNGNWNDEFVHRLSQARSLARQLRSSTLSRSASAIAYSMFIAPSIEFPLSVTGFKEVESRTIQAPLLAALLPKLGFARHLPRTVVFGPVEYGGLGVHSHYTEQCVQHITTLVGHLRQPGRLGDLIRCDMRWCQLIAGTSAPILASPHTAMPHVSPSWIMQVRTSLKDTQTSCIMPATGIIPPQRVGDIHIMDVFLSKYKSAKLQRLNACRLWLKVTCLSDITTADGRRLRPAALLGQRPVIPIQSGQHWPRQERPSDKVWKDWSSSLRLHFSIDGKSPRLRDPLLEWLTVDTAKWPDLYDHETTSLFRRQADGSIQRFMGLQNRTRASTVLCSLFSTRWSHEIPTSSTPADITYHPSGLHITTTRQASPAPPPSNDACSSFAAFIASQPRNIQRLLFRCALDPAAIHPVVSAIEYGAAILGASDGGLKLGTGAFGWVWSIDGGLSVCSFGAGPSDTTRTDQSSTRTEIEGIFAALTFLRLVCEYFHIVPPPSTSLRLVCDNRGALKCARSAAAADWFSSSRSYANYDLAAELRACIQALPIPTQFEWVKGHQSDRKQFEQLTPEAQLNERSDSLATAFLEDRTNHHIPAESPTWSAQEVYITSTEGPITGNLASSLRELRHLPALRDYYTEKYTWHSSTWATIDHGATSLAIRRLSPGDRRRIVQLRCGWLPVNKRLAKFMPDREPACPRCNDTATIESVEHLIICPFSEPTILVFIHKLDQHLRTDSTLHPLRTAMITGLLHWARHPELPLEWEESHFPVEVNKALKAQEAIGWGLMIRGFCASAWSRAQHSHYCTLPRENHATGPLWSARLIQCFFQLFFDNWKHRNGAVHGANEVAQQAIQRAALRTAIEHQFSFSNALLPVDRQEIFGALTPLKVLSFTPRAQADFIAFAKDCLPSALARKDAHVPGQTTMTQYMARAPSNSRAQHRDHPD